MANEKTMKVIASTLVNNQELYVPNGNGEFLLYIKNGISLNYKGLVKTFDGVLIDGNYADGTLIPDIELEKEFNKKLPKIKGSIGYVILSIKIPETNDEKSAIVEYIYNGTNLVKKFSSVNRELIVTNKITENSSKSRKGYIIL